MNKSELDIFINDLEFQVDNLKKINEFQNKISSIKYNKFKIEKGYVVPKEELDDVREFINYFNSIERIIAQNYEYFSKYLLKNIPEKLNIDNIFENTTCLKILNIYFIFKTIKPHKSRKSCNDHYKPKTILSEIIYINDDYHLSVMKNTLLLTKGETKFHLNMNAEAFFLYDIYNEKERYSFLNSEYYLKIDRIKKDKEKLTEYKISEYPFLYDLLGNVQISSNEVKIGYSIYNFINIKEFGYLFKDKKNKALFWSIVLSKYEHSVNKTESISERIKNISSMYEEFKKQLNNKDVEVVDWNISVLFHSGTSEDIASLINNKYK